MNTRTKRLLYTFAVLSIGLLLVFLVDFSSSDPAKRFAQPISQKIQAVEAAFDLDFIDLLMKNRPDDDVNFTSLSINSNHPYYIFSDNGELLYWSEFTFIPDFENIQVSVNPSILETREGIFFSKLRRFSRNERSFWLLQVYPLILNSVVQNDYLPSGYNQEVFGSEDFVIVSEQSDRGIPILGLKNDVLFYVSFQENYRSIGESRNLPVLVFFFSLLALVAILSNDLVRMLWRKGHSWKAVLYTLLILVAVRGAMLSLSFPKDFFDFALFDSVQYASSWVNPSLGDLLLNMLAVMLVFGMVLKILAFPNFSFLVLMSDTNFPHWLKLILAYILSFFFLALFYSLYVNILTNSQWDLNILSLPSFDLFKGLSLLIIFFGASIYLLFNLYGLKVIMDEQSFQKGKAIQLLLLLFIPLNIFLLWVNWIWAILVFVHLFFLVSVIGFQLFQNVQRIGLSTFLTFFFGCLIAGLITGIASYEVYLEREIESKERFGSQQLLENDLMAEFLLADVMEKIREDLFIRAAITDPFQPKEAIERKIRRIHLPNYFDQYAIKVKVFNTNGDNILNREDISTLQDLRVSYVKSDFVTSVRDLYMPSISGGEFLNKFYTAFVPLFREGNLIGTVYLEMQQLRVLPSAVFPKLLLDNRYSNFFNEQSYDYAVLVEGELQYTVGVFNYRMATFEKSMQDPELFARGIHRNGYHHLGVQDGTKTVVVSSPNYPIYYILADISLFFISFILLTLISMFAYALFKGLGKVDFNFATKLQMYLNFAFFFPILIISVIIIGLLSNSYQEELDRQYLEKVTILRDNLTTVLERQEAGISARDEFPEAVNTLSATSNTEINVYGASGTMLYSSQPTIFDKRIISRKINPQAIVEIVEKANNVALIKEHVGGLNFKSVYAAIRSSDGETIQAIISVPFFESEEELDRLIADVLSNIINIFVLIFIIFLFVSYFVSKQITHPFKLLTQKLKMTGLEDNEPMYWPSRDEIGLLVNEYNNMLFKLEASKKVLSETEKESAWREMAKQVAHEIKNPLTPMKLTLQHLLRLQADNKLDDPSMLKRPIETLIHQVDTLSDIATSFSTFAKMPLPKNEIVNFKKVISDTIELFKSREKGAIYFADESSMDVVEIKGDDQLVGRIISNLIINGIQAVDGRKKPVIRLRLYKDHSDAVLSVEDNGKGIPDSLKDKIFIPNFSTKSEGSGLGLAIAKRGTETIGGKIWFETGEGKGTIFYLSFPCVNRET
ncbi:sensor histidine kinase [Mongoliitalea daihaiensis]|uniref:sensor histidine kinase n=1 Tax=Mongoliitalea daihaiensis TaxID=2782006 RepID=UPI001F3113F2|nr:HAMP domain-containing sensor histidine kinase [Mongoliitalea daihaiensis]UJP66859.1 HAMP domain-containing histidine kinase [Mongoliitalea daihaiensis]